MSPYRPGPQRHFRWPLWVELWVESVLMLACGSVASSLLVLGIYACAATPPTPLTALQQTEIAAYSQQELACVADSATRAQADQCIAGVRAQWCNPGAPLQQQGACGDAGAEASIPVGPTLSALLDKFTARDAAPEAETSAPAVTSDAGGQ